MLSDSRHTSKFQKGNLGDLLQMGHFVQDLRTLDIIVGKEWEIVNKDLLPDHRDIVVHLKKI